MLWAALLGVLIFMMFGSSSDILFDPWVQKEAKGHFEEVIQDKERSEKAMVTLDEMSRNAKNFTQDLEKTGKKLETLVKEYRSTREDFNQLFSEIQGKREVATAKILDLIPDLKKNILREEWVKAFDLEMNL